MKIIKILDASQINYVKNLIEDLEFHDGKKSAGGLAKSVKLNKHAVAEGDKYQELVSYIGDNLKTKQWLKKRYLQKAFSTPLINKYEVGDGYGRHFENSHIRTESGSIKLDLSFTLMFSSKSDYEGGRGENSKLKLEV